jgi:hypothetical protein
MDISPGKTMTFMHGIETAIKIDTYGREFKRIHDCNHGIQPFRRQKNSQKTRFTTASAQPV